MLRSLENIKGYTVSATDGKIGKIHDFYFDDHSWTIRYFVINTGKWLFGGKVLISPIALNRPDWEEEIFPVSLTKKQVKNSPDVNMEKPISRKYEAALHQYYSWPIYWGGTLTPETPSLIPPEPTDTAVETVKEEELTEEEKEGSNLRSTKEVDGYHIQATDGEIGHVTDFICDEQSWIIRYLTVDTRNWLPGKKVLVSPQWIEDISWIESKIYVRLSREKIKNAPEYNPKEPVTREYEKELYEYYGQSKYWK